MSRPSTPAAPRSRRVFPGSPSLTALRASDGVEYAAFRRTLQPRYGRVWLDLACRWALLSVGYVGLVLAAPLLGTRAWYWVVPAAAWIGFWFASVVLFMHEAAHFLLHPDKAVNDRLADLCICWMVGDDVGSYRLLHWQHHLHLGDTHDTEVSYHYAPTLRFALETLLGVHAWRVFWTHRAARADDEGRPLDQRAPMGSVVRGVIVHTAILAPAAWLGAWPAVAAWVLGVLVVFPYLSALRQQLEHRAEDARCDTNYAAVPQGAVNRMFRSTPMARAFGSAGFRRHLLHHWDPSVSYDRFDDLEAYLLRTSLAPEIEASRTTYAEAWRRLTRRERDLAG